ncbi:MAG TPA: hypothetical protein EYG98_01905 [Sulfurovum sp.]|nr:hypothetical protein [Sulfurovum sp.]
MIPLILGGIALAAVGYGVKDYCESEGCPWDDDVHTPAESNEIFTHLHKSKIKLHEETLPKLRSLLSIIELAEHKFALDDIVCLLKEELDHVRASKDTELYATVYQNVLDDALAVLGSYIIAMEKIAENHILLEASEKFYKNLIQEAHKLTNSTQKVLALHLRDEHGIALIDNIVLLIEYRRMLDIHRDMLEEQPDWFAYSVAMEGV